MANSLYLLIEFLIFIFLIDAQQQKSRETLRFCYALGHIISLGTVNRAIWKRLEKSKRNGEKERGPKIKRTING